MENKKNIAIAGKHLKPILVDLHFNDNRKQKPIIIFCHGYKGFKDWGAWNLMADHFANENYFFVKFNFSHNGGNVNTPIDFPDLEAFGNNNYIIELDDLETVIHWLERNKGLKANCNINNITLIGHSRGGGIVAIKAEEDTRVKRVVMLAGVSDFASRFPEGNDLETWRNTGVTYVVNGRTQQRMPHYYQFYENFVLNQDRLTIKRAVSHLKIPHLIIQGDVDTSVTMEEAKRLMHWNPKSSLVVLKGSNHVFGASHPWNKETMPEHLNQVVLVVLNFLN